MKIHGSVALVTGANRGLGREFARELVSRGAAKVYGAAAWSLTNGVRLELHHQGTLVVAVYASFIDTDMAALAADVPKDSPGSVARQVFDAVEAGQIEVFADERSRTVKAELSRDQELIYPPVQKFWDAAVGGQQDQPRAGHQPRQ